MKSLMKTGLTLITVMLAMGTVSADPALVKKLDKDEDGKISIKEAANHPELLASFGSIDVDADGLITAKELEEAHAEDKVNVVKADKGK